MIPYIENFYTKQEADELFEFIKAQPFVRPPNPRNKTYRLRRLSFPGYSPPIPPTRAARKFKPPSNYDVSRSVAEAPELYKKFAKRLSEYAGREINYMSTMGYLTDDHMDFHQHEEDKGREDQTVWVLSLGAVHPVAVRPKGVKDKSQWEIIHPAHGSLYILPSEYNLTHEHAVLEGTDYSYSGLRIAINTKHIPPISPVARFLMDAQKANAGNSKCPPKKPSPVSCRPSEGGILMPSSGPWRNSGTGSPTECWTFKTSESPTDAVDSSLSDILETGDVPSKYFLTPKACAGILQPAASRKRSGKLSARLEKALKDVAARNESTQEPKLTTNTEPAQIQMAKAADFAGYARTLEKELMAANPQRKPLPDEEILLARLIQGLYSNPAVRRFVELGKRDEFNSYGFVHRARRDRRNGKYVYRWTRRQAWDLMREVGNLAYNLWEVGDLMGMPPGMNPSKDDESSVPSWPAGDTPIG
jgi:hypothetical protein